MTKLRRKIRLWPRKQSESHASDYRSATEDERAILKKAAWRWQTATVTCSVCTEEVKHSKFPEHPITSACTHPLTDICTKCLQTHLEVQVSSTTGLGIPCPICRSPLSYPDMQRNAAAEIFARYSERDAHNTIEHTPGFIWCPISGWGSGQIHEGGADAPIVTCVNCRQLFCFTHRRKWHAGLTCEQVDEDPLLEEELEGEQITQSTKRRGLSEKERRENEAKKAERATRRKEEQLGEEMAKRISKRCIGPNCNWRAEKDNGCKHVTCKYLMQIFLFLWRGLILYRRTRRKVQIRVLFPMLATMEIRPFERELPALFRRGKQDGRKGIPGHHSRINADR